VTQSRRTFLTGITATAAAATRIAHAKMPAPRAVEAIAFDGFPIIDPRPVATRTEALFPGKGAALMNAWRTRQFEYTWLRTLGSAYADFRQITQEALVYAAASLGLALSEAARDHLMQSFLQLQVWDDARPALEALRGAGIRMAFLSNLTPAMLDAAIARADLGGFFEPHLTMDRVRVFKPDRRAYEMGPRAFRARPDEIVFCASAGWDAAGARWFGYRTFWVNRSQQPVEELGVRPDGIGADMADFARFVLGT
jgi:2-haloacid dehalogenase